MRDAFPSGHAAVTLVVQWYAFRYFQRRGFWLLPLTVALLFSTVYLGYHYAVDILAGAVLAVFCIVVTQNRDQGSGSGVIGQSSAGRESGMDESRSPFEDAELVRRRHALLFAAGPLQAHLYSLSIGSRTA